MEIAINPSVQLLTTPSSVAGRGVFAVGPLEKDEIVAAIPTYAMFHPSNAAGMFPHVADRIKKQANRSKRNWLVKMKRRILRKKSPDIPWEVELTEYALAALEEDHPFSPWISQWSRNDPVVELLKSGVSRDNQKGIEATAKELNKMLPEMPLYKIMAALHIRFKQFESHQRYLSQPNSPKTAFMYATLTSRTIGITDDVISVCPFHDMINHSFEPNLQLDFSADGHYLELHALSDIREGDELFLCYTKIGKEYDEDAALWVLINWGIPVAKSEWKVQKVPASEEPSRVAQTS